MTIEKQTVLILGAAASSHCDYPLGKGLINSIVSMHRNGRIKIPKPWKKKDADQFTTRLSRAGYPSIDAFLEKTDSDSALGKYLIAYCLKQYEDLDRLFPPNEPGWYEYLFNQLLGSGETPFEGNQLTIITYNYDRSLEAYLCHALASRFDIDLHQANEELRKVPIIHVHGILGDFPETPYEKNDDPDTILSISKKIEIVHEIQESRDGFFCNEQFRRASAAIRDATKVIFFGFGFHFDNVRRLGVSWNKLDCEVRSTFYDTTASEHERLMSGLSELGLSKKRPLLENMSACQLFFRYVSPLE